MTITVCFDALGTCFSLEPCIKALDDILGKELRAAGSHARMTIMDWVCHFLVPADSSSTPPNVITRTDQ